MSRFNPFNYFGRGQAANAVPQTSNQPLINDEDGQRFVIGRGESISVDGTPVLTIDNDDVRLRNNGQLETQGDTATIEVNGEDAAIDNRRGATIEAEDTAIQVNGEDARIFNAGRIEGDFNGVSFSESAESGKVVNRGVISSDSRAVDIDGDDHSLVNHGLILGTGDQRNGTVYADDTANDYSIDNGRRGTIDAGQGNDGAGISLSLDAGGNGDVTIDNDGRIAGRGDASAGLATAGDGIRLESVREGGALVGNEALFEGEIYNSGKVTSEGANGTVGAFRSVNGVDFQGSLINQRGGVFEGGQNGVYFGTGDHSGGEFVNSGLVTSDSRAVNIDGHGLSVENNGLILGTGNQRNGTVYADDTASDYSIENGRRGTIDAGRGNEGAGVSLSLDTDGPGDVSIDNSGRIIGRGDASRRPGDGRRRHPPGGHPRGQRTGRQCGPLRGRDQQRRQGHVRRRKRHRRCLPLGQRRRLPGQPGQRTRWPFRRRTERRLLRHRRPQRRRVRQQRRRDLR